MSTKRGRWRKGAPPSVGWWPASYYRVPHDIRWWNGRFWSKPANAFHTAEQAAAIAVQAAAYSFDVEWTDRPRDWPEQQ